MKTYPSLFLARMESSKQSYILPARRAQWLVSALSYTYGLSQPMQNEVVVLATGLDQYLQELFHHLDFDGAEGVSRHHFQTLLHVLGLYQCRNQYMFEKEDTNGFMDFKEFHQKLVHMLIDEKDEEGFIASKKWRCEGEFVEAEVQMAPREGHTVRTICTECFNKKPLSDILHSVLYKQGKSPLNEEVVTNESQLKDSRESVYDQTQVSQLQEENEGLRELVEDMRQALQSSDANNLALQVALHDLRSGHKLSNVGTDNAKQVKYPNILLSELYKLQDKRNRQLEEAILYTQELEADLWRSRKDQESLNKARGALMYNQKLVTEQLEKARNVLSVGLQRVKVLEEQSGKVEELQRNLKEIQLTLVGDLRHCTRQCCSKATYTTSDVTDTEGENNSYVFQTESNRTSPTGSSGSSWTEEPEDRTSFRSLDTEQMIRADVEGQEGSDDEPDWQPTCNGSDTGTIRRAKVGELQAKLDQMRQQLQQGLQEKKHIMITLDKEREDNFTRCEENLKEIDQLHKEIQHLETERVRLSLVENSTKEVITLLQRLKLHLSHRSIGKLIMDTLDNCLQDNTKDPEGDAKRFLHSFLKQLQHQNQILHSHQSKPESSYSNQVLHITRNNPVMMTALAGRCRVSNGRRLNTSSFQVKTDFYQFGGRLNQKNKTNFKTIKTELGTV